MSELPAEGGSLPDTDLSSDTGGSDGRLPSPAVAGHDESSERAEPVEAAQGKYVYCIIESSEEFDLGPIGIGEGENEVYTVHYGNLAAVVSDTPIKLYDPTRENLLAHELVNETVMRDHTVIPMSFGTIFRTEEDVAELLRTTGKAFEDVLHKIRGKFELGLKVLWDREEVVARLERDNEEISGLRKEIAEASQASTYFARMQLDRLIDGALEEQANHFVSVIYEQLRPVSVASRSSKLIGDNMIMNVAFLVDRSMEAQFDESVKELNERYQDVLSFKYTGPWPPYNFVNIKLKLERADT